MTLATRARAALHRLAVVAVVTGATAVAGSLAAPTPAQAHPLGNATVNHYDGLTLRTDRVLDTAVVDTAEIPTLQRAPMIDLDGDGAISPTEAGRYAGQRCAALASAHTLTVDATPVPFTVTTAAYGQTPGAAGLPVGRLECDLTARADLSQPATVTVADGFDADGIGGWHEITAVGDGVTLHDSPVSATSVSDQLRRYPDDLLSSPLDVRSARIATTPGAGVSTLGPVAALPGADAVLRTLNSLSNQFNALVGADRLSLGAVALAIALAIALGAGHAFLPGHGKTIMAAYLVGKRGRLRDVVTVGATVTLTHTVGVLVLGLAVTASAAIVPTAIEQLLAVASGLIVAGVGVGLLISALRRRGTPILLTAPALVPAGAPPTSAPATGHGHGHGHGHGFGRGGLVGLGIAGGLVPSPSALLVLLAAAALGRTWLGVVLVLGYGLGMAAALSLAGLVLVRLQNRITTLLARPRAARTATRLQRVLTRLPVLTALLVILVGAGLVLRALSGSV